LLRDEKFSNAVFPLRFLTLSGKNAIHSQILPGKQKGSSEVWNAPDNPVLCVKKCRCRKILLVCLRVKVQMLQDLHNEAIIYCGDDRIQFGEDVNQLIPAGLTDMGSGGPFYSRYIWLEN